MKTKMYRKQNRKTEQKKKQVRTEITRRVSLVRNLVSVTGFSLVVSLGLTRRVRRENINNPKARSLKTKHDRNTTPASGRRRLLSPLRRVCRRPDWVFADGFYRWIPDGVAVGFQRRAIRSGSELWIADSVHIVRRSICRAIKLLSCYPGAAYTRVPDAPKTVTADGRWVAR